MAPRGSGWAVTEMTMTLARTRPRVFDLLAGFPALSMLSPDGGKIQAQPGHELVDLFTLDMIPAIGGGDRGYHADGDIIRETVDGVSLNDLWGDYQASLNEWNTYRDRLVSFLTFNTTLVSEQVFQGGSTADFEEATEYGEPVGHRPQLAGETMGYPFKWWDLAGRYTWQYLANATAQETDAFNNMALEADNRLVFMHVMRTLFANSRRVNKEGVPVYPFYSGEAGDQPHDYKMRTFADNHNHFVTTGAATLDAPDLEALMTLMTEHGYTQRNGYNMVVLVNEAEGNVIRQFRSTANGGTGLYDFVPAAGTPSFLLPEDMRTEGGRPGSTIAGLEVIGAYGNATIVQEDFIPAGYLVAFVTGGEQNLTNPLAIREHPTATLRGLKLAKGKQPDYPLIDSFYVRGFGVGVRHRGAGAIMQVTANAAYTVPAQYA